MSKQTINPIRGLPIRERFKIVKAVRKGKAVRDPGLAGRAVAYARWIQAPERQVGVTRLLSWLQVGRFGSLVIFAGIALLLGANVVVMVLGALGLLVLMGLLSPRERRARNARAAAAEAKNLELVDTPGT